MRTRSVVLPLLLVPALAACSAALHDGSESEPIGTRRSALLTLGNEQTVGATTLGAAAFEQRSVATSFDGTNFLVAWSDGRVRGSAGIRGTRVAPDGTLLDPIGFPISETVDGTTTVRDSSGAGGPAIAWNGTEHLVVWQRGAVDEYGGTTIHSAMVSPSGAVRQTTPAAPINGTYSTPQRVALAAGATGFLAVFEGSYRLQGLFFDANGVPAAAPVTLVQVTGSATGPAVAFDGTNYLVVWSGRLTSSGNQGIWAQRFDSTGAKVDAAPFSVSGNVWAKTATAARVGTSVLVAWEDSGSSSGSEWDVKGAFVTPSTITTPTRFLIAGGTSWQYRPSIAFDGTNVLVAYDSGTYRDVYAVRLSTSGAVLPGGPTLVLDGSGETTGAAAAFGGGTFLVAGSSFLLDSGREAVAARVDSAGARVDAAPFVLSRGAPAQIMPALGWSADRALMVWSAWNGTNWDLRGMRFDVNGQPLDPAPLVISAGDDNQLEPFVTSNGTDFFVVWNDDRNDNTGYMREIFGARVKGDGTVEDPSGVGIAMGNASSSLSNRRRVPVAAWDGQNYVVAWWDNGEVRAALVSPAGLAGAQVVVGETDNDGMVALACGLTECALGFQVVNSRYRPLGIFRVDRSLAAIGTSMHLSSPTDDATQASMTFDGTRYVAVWSSQWDPGLRGARFLPNGTKLDATPVELAPGVDVRLPRLAWDGGKLLAAWQQASGTDWTAMARELDSSSALTGGAAFALAAQPAAERAPAIAASRSGAIAAAWEEFDGALGAMRVHLRIGTGRTGLGTPCVVNGDCDSGFCADGVCCDQACGSDTSDCRACSVAAGAAVDGTCGPVTENASCDDGSACTRLDLCRSGVCQGTDPVICADKVCHAAPSCDPQTGICADGAPLNGTSCDDGLSCTANDRCTAGSCGGTAKQRPVPGDCELVATACDPDTGSFPTARAPDGTTCSIGTCRGGVCVAPEAPDAGQPPDAAEGGPDASGQAPDAGAPADASEPVNPQPPGAEPSGCGCGSSGESAAAPMLVLGLAALTRRRVFRA